MKTKSRLLALALVLLMVFTALSLVSCGDAGNSSTTTAKTESTGGATSSYQFSNVKYSGDFTVYARSNASSYNATYIIAEEENGDVVNDATARRNIRVEDKFGIKLKWIEGSEPKSTFENEIKGGSIEYDLILERRNQISQFATKGYLYDFQNLDTDFSQEWWDSNCVRDLSIKGHTYLMGNSVSIARLSGIRFFYFNKDIIADYHLDNPYDLLASNDWTLENFVKMVKGVSHSEGNASLGTHALVLETGSANGIYMHLIVGCGVEYSTFDDDGKIVCTLGEKSKIEKIDSIFDTLRTVFNDPTHVIDMKTAVNLDTSGTAKGDNNYDKARSLFAQGHFLFTHGSINVSEQFIDMESDFGCMPNPKYNKDQENYVHKCDPYTLIFAIPNDEVIDKSRVADVMEYWGYESENEVIPAFYEVTIKARRMSDTTAPNVVDIVKNTAKYEVTDVFKLGNIPTVLNEAYKGATIASQWKSKEAECLAQIDLLNGAIE